jgi:hypothetical protein
MLGEQQKQNSLLKSYLGDEEFVNLYSKFMPAISSSIKKKLDSAGIAEYCVISATNFLTKHQKPDLNYARFVHESGASYTSEKNKFLFREITGKNQLVVSGFIDLEDRRKDIPFIWNSNKIISKHNFRTDKRCIL